MLVEREGLSPDEEKQRWKDFSQGSALFQSHIEGTRDFDLTAAHVIQSPEAPTLFKELLTVGEAYRDGLPAALEVARNISGVPVKISVPSIEFVGPDEVIQTHEPEVETFGFIVGIVGCAMPTLSGRVPTFFGIASIPMKEGDPSYLGVDVPFGMPLPTYLMKDYLNPRIQGATIGEITAAALTNRLNSKNPLLQNIKHAAA